MNIKTSYRTLNQDKASFSSRRTDTIRLARAVQAGYTIKQPERHDMLGNTLPPKAKHHDLLGNPVSEEDYQARREAVEEMFGGITKNPYIGGMVTDGYADERRAIKREYFKKR